MTGSGTLKSDWAANRVDQAVARLWLEHGGDHHGPRVETVTMPMANLMGFVRALALVEGDGSANASPSQPDAARHGSDEAGEPSGAVANWMIAHSYATGHGDTIEDMLEELEAQAKERAAAPAPLTCPHATQSPLRYCLPCTVSPCPMERS